MNENINIAKILKDAPQGTELWSPLCGECYLIGASLLSPITVEIKDDKNDSNVKLFFAADGKYFSRFTSSECLLFPSKENRDWSTFKYSLKHKNFKPFQKVLIARDINGDNIWIADIYSHYKDGLHYTISVGIGLSGDKIVPYEGNEDKLGKLYTETNKY